MVDLKRSAAVAAGTAGSEREQAALQEVVDSLFRVGPRARGTIYDAYVGNLDIASCHVESITVPTLVIHAQDDTLSPYPDSRAMAQRIPGAQFLTVHRGGHTLTHLDLDARRAGEEFLNAVRATPEP
jgi:pimeloyl-ACP methyl ester carboxylesterase